MNPEIPQIVFDQDELVYHCSGEWSVLCLADLTRNLSTFSPPEHRSLKVSGKQLETLDSAGALCLANYISLMEARGNQVDVVEFSETQMKLLELVQSKKSSLSYQAPAPEKKGFLYALGKESVFKLKQVDGLIILIGDLTTRFWEALSSWRRFQIPSIISNIQSAGIMALPIVALLSFLIGVVLAYQMGLQLETYGANIFIAYLSGMAIFREFAPLITSIIVAGRTSSAFTAQLGSMKINEEVDAIQTMGLSPTELLVMPKIIGLLLVFPLLIFWADIFSIIGAMMMSKMMLNISYYDFLERLRDSVGLRQMMLGLYKAPAFALLVGLVGCFQGFRVQANADSIGSQTTKSVVQALFLIIIADAVFSVVYSWLDL